MLSLIYKIGGDINPLKKSLDGVKDEAKKAEDAWKQYLKEYEAGLKRINDAYDAYLKLLPKLQPALKEAMQTATIEGQNRALVASKEAADAAFKAMKDGAEPLPSLIKEAGDTVQDMGDKLGTAAGAVLTVGENFGGLDDEVAIHRRHRVVARSGAGHQVGNIGAGGGSHSGACHRR